MHLNWGCGHIKIGLQKKKKKNGKRKEKKNKKQETKHYHQKGGRGEGKSIQRGGSLF